MSPPQTIAVDARLVFDEPWRGIAKTIVGLYQALAVVRPEWRFHLFYREGRNPSPFADCPNIHPQRIDIRGDRFDLWDQVRLPWAIWQVGADLFHAPAGIAPRFPFAPVVSTLHDLIPLDTRPHDSDAREWVAKVCRTARRARVVLTASEFSRDRIIAAFGLDSNRIAVIPWAPLVPAIPVPVDPGKRPYVLHFGLADPRKNTRRVLAAWGQLRPELRAVFLLQIVGVEGPFRLKLEQEAQQLGDSVRVVGYLPEEEVRLRLAGAAVLCYPTLYEGFGLPALDAMALGVPVLTSSTTSLPEVVDDAALCVDPTDTVALAACLTRLLTDAALRADLVRRGRERVQLFTWEQTAEMTARRMEAAITGG